MAGMVTLLVTLQDLLREAAVILRKIWIWGQLHDAARVPHEIALRRGTAHEAAERQPEPRQQAAKIEQGRTRQHASPSTPPSSQDSTMTG
jgi:hypothetical protein